MPALTTALRILLVEDDDATRGALARLLRRAGAEVTTAPDGAEGLDRLLRGRFDVLLTDLHMPTAAMDGVGLLQHARALPLANRPRRTIAMSGEYDRRALGDLMDQSASVDFFFKPVDLNQLLDTLGGASN